MLMRVVLRFILGLLTDVFSLFLDVSQVARVQRLQLMDMQGMRILCRWRYMRQNLQLRVFELAARCDGCTATFAMEVWTAEEIAIVTNERSESR